jgi:predicted phosphodiesterase
MLISPPETIIQAFSDIHTEQYNGQFDISYLGIREDCDYLIFAGDIASYPDMAHDFFSRIRRNYKATILYVLGNHEYYRQKFSGVVGNYKKALKGIKNLFVLEKEVHSTVGLTFLGATYWSNLRISDPDILKQYVCDFSYIQDSKDRSTSPDRVYDILMKSHNESKSWMMEALKSYQNSKRIVITHHLPSINSVHKKYKTSHLNGSFYSNSDELVMNSNLWVHGHTHQYMYYNMDKKKAVYCNPMGYLQEPCSFKMGEYFSIKRGLNSAISRKTFKHRGGS